MMLTTVHIIHTRESIEDVFGKFVLNLSIFSFHFPDEHLPPVVYGCYFSLAKRQQIWPYILLSCWVATGVPASQ